MKGTRVQFFKSFEVAKKIDWHAVPYLKRKGKEKKKKKKEKKKEKKREKKKEKKKGEKP